MENNEEKILTLKSLDKDMRLKLEDIDRKLEDIEKKIEIVENVLRR
uniref:Cytoplasmic FMR1-interacting protein 1 n=1 Tax=virus sp. cti5L29 TaxID=2826813 RepID=A0A8S5R8W1_9VIRU|nr:MAG TPA: cytoplasmic FMR1-interacting protein 1 [virus sp. cti5L29]